MNAINRQFGTWRGVVRLALSYPQQWLGFYRKRPSDFKSVKRLVFVCRGNISRSAYADRLAKQNGLNSASFGMSTEGGGPADPVATSLGNARGLNMAAHISCGVDGYDPRPGDLMLAMEVRQLEQLADHPKTKAFPRLLLGQFSGRIFGTPHLHDPFTLSEDYYAACFARIDKALDRLAIIFPNAKTS